MEKLKKSKSLHHAKFQAQGKAGFHSNKKNVPMKKKPSTKKVNAMPAKKKMEQKHGTRIPKGYAVHPIQPIFKRFGV